MSIQHFHTATRRVAYRDGLAAFRALRGGPAILLESLHATDQLARLSLVARGPSIRLRGTEHSCRVERLAERGGMFLRAIAEAFRDYIIAQSPEALELHFPAADFSGPESERFGRPVPGAVPRFLAARFHQPERNYMGLYGAFGYHFVLQYEDIERLNPAETPDYDLFLCEDVVLINHLTQAAECMATRADEAAAEDALAALTARLEAGGDSGGIGHFSAGPVALSPTPEVFMQHVEAARELCARGELMELVLSRELTAGVSGDPLSLYAAYRDLNPAPYLFFVEFDAENVLLGASPEVMTRVENGKAILRPISGSAPRGANPVDDHTNMLALLNSAKEKAELDMLIDLARNDLARVCQPGVALEHYRAVEKYARVMHTVAQVAGRLPEGRQAMDVLLASLNAGTLTGAPKPAALRHIERLEEHARGYYGGAVGYVHFNNELNTGIVIRSAHIHQGRLRYCSGATLLHASDPAAELAETAFKAAAFQEILAQFSANHVPA